MRSLATITTGPEQTRLTTVETVKSELSITTDVHDDVLGRKIDEATSDIEAHIGRVLNRVTLTETFWGGPGYGEYLILSRAPVASITSVTLDDVAVDTDEYRLDADAGILYRLDASGYPCTWTWTNKIVLVYEAGFLLPGENDRDLPHALEGAAIALVNSYWQAKGRDPMVKAEDVPGLGSVQYWVGSVGEAGQLPPDVVAKISPFRRILV